MMLRFPLLIMFFLPGLLSFGQQFGGNPPSQKWKQINSDTARIIFPPGLESQARRVASVVHTMAARQPASIGNRLYKVNIVLQNQTTVANGYVGLGPFRSEYFLIPDPDNFGLGSIAWTDMLALHEYRHVMQFNNFRKGLSKTMYRLFGDDGLALAQAVAVPDWFFEGDAVYSETILSGQGRGRLSLFMNSFPGLWQQGKNYSWMKLRNGSMKDYVPNHYNLGYLLVNYGFQKYGIDFWKKVTADASAFKGLLYPFQKAVKKYAGIEYKNFVSDAFHYYQMTGAGNDKVIATQQKVNRSGEAGIQKIFPENKKFVTNYRFPYQLGGDSLLYLKSSYRQLPSFYIKSAAGEKKLRKKDISVDEQFSYRNGKIVYAAYETDPRWAWRDYSVIRLLDIKSNKQRTITRKSKYFTPDISPDGSRIAAVQNDVNGESSLHILDAADGRVLKSIRSGEIALFTDPKFIDDSSLVTAVRLPDGKMALARVYWQEGKTIRLTPPSFHVLGYPCVEKDMIYFTASYNGNDDVFALRMSDKKIFQITHGPLGNYFVNAFRQSGKLTAQDTLSRQLVEPLRGDLSLTKITWSSFTANGYQLMQLDEKDIEWKEVDMALTSALIPRFPVSNEAAFGKNFLDNVPQRNFPVKNYSKSTGLFHIHSWRPYYSDPEFTYSIYGENILNTFQSEFYYLYNRNDREHAVGLNALYGAWFPYLNMGTQMTFDREAMIGNRVKKWNQLDSRLGLSVPLLFTSGRTLKQLDMGSFYVLRNEFNKDYYKDSLGQVSFSYLSHSFSWNQQVQRAVQQIFPKWGYGFSLAHRHAITRFIGFQFLGGASFYLPGLHPAHSLVLTGAYQERDTLGQISFSNRFSYSRGYTGRYFSRMWRLSANYHLPLLYPDWGFANILYLQRVRANAFFDFTKIYSRDKKITRDQRSVGAEIYVDTKWWNQYPLAFGFRISRLLDPDQFNGFKGTLFEIIVPVSIIPK